MKINVYTDLEDWSKLVIIKKYGVHKKIKPFCKWYINLEIIGNSLLLHLKLKQENKSENDTLINLILPSKDKNGRKLKILK